MVMPSEALVDLSRLQFAFTAIFHFLFVPLTLGLTWLLVIMEGCYLVTGKQVYKDMTKFWGKLLVINFAMGVVTGVTMEIEFGTNWAYFSRFSGDAFSTVLAIEGITAFMLEASLIGVFMLGWDKISKGMHWLVTWGVAIGSNLSVVNILVANSWMQHPFHTTFNYQTMHVAVQSIWDIYMATLAQVRVAHVMLGGLMTGCFFVLGISAYYLIKGRDIGFAKRSMAIAIGAGFITCLCVGFFGDQNGLQVAHTEPQKMAAIEAVWSTPKAPAPWTIIGFPSQSEMKNHFAIQIPYGLSIIATHSLSGTVEGEKQIIQKAVPRVESGLIAYQALVKLRSGDTSPATIETFRAHKKDFGYGLLLKEVDPNMTAPTAQQIHAAARHVIPEVWPVFWAFRIMVLAWILMLLLLLWGLYYLARGTMHKHSWFAHLCLWGICLPWIAEEFGWITAEIGRQPWILHGLLPTYIGTSMLSTPSVAFSLGGFILLYFSLFCVELFLMFKFARIGPSSLNHGRYYFEARPTRASKKDEDAHQGKDK